MTASPKMFPIQSERGAAPHPTQISWETAELAYSVYSAKYGRGQSLEHLAQRGGFGPSEMDVFLPDWRTRESLLAQWQIKCHAAEKERDHWKANHDEMVARNGVLRVRNDLPVDRTDALRRFELLLKDKDARIAELTEALNKAPERSEINQLFVQYGVDFEEVESMLRHRARSNTP